MTAAETLLDDVRPFHFGLTSFQFPHNVIYNMDVAPHALFMSEEAVSVEIHNMRVKKYEDKI